MESAWNIVAFPVILPWREEFWTLPLYLPDLKVGVIPKWPEILAYQGVPLPPEAEVHPRELQHYQPGDLRQWQAYADYRRDREEAGEDIIQAIRGYEPPPAPKPQVPSPQAWSLVWQLEKMQADQDAKLLLVDKGEEWLQEVFKPEPWVDPESFGPVPGIEEMVDPELAQLRYRLWRRVLAVALQDQSIPLLLGRTSRSLFLALKGWPEWSDLRTLPLSLPGCRNGAEWQTVCGDTGKPPWQQQFAALLAALFAAVANRQEPHAALRNLHEFVEDDIAAHWPLGERWNWDLEIWLPDAAAADEGPVLCWTGASAGILPG